MRVIGRLKSLMALTLTLTLAGAGLPAFAGSAPTTLSGKILINGSAAPAEGAIVKLAEHEEGTLYQSAKADAKGSYAIEGLPAGAYDVAVETSKGLFVVGAPITLSTGTDHKATFALRAEEGEGAGGTGTEPKPAEPAPTPTEPAKPATPPPAAAPAKTPWYRSGWFGATVVVGSAVLIGALISSSDEDETVASPSSD